MAILKVVQAPNGATGEYNKLVKAEVFADNMTVVITTNVYATEEARDQGLNILWVDRTTIPFAAFTQDPRNVFYDILSHYSYSPFYGGASDGTTVVDHTIELTPEAQEDVNYGDTIQMDNGTPNTNNQMFERWSRKYLIADGTDISTISNLPNPTTITFLKAPASVGHIAPITEESGSFSFGTSVPGEYTIKTSAFNYYDSLITITAYPVGSELPPEPTYPQATNVNPPNDTTQVDNGGTE